MRRTVVCVSLFIVTFIALLMTASAGGKEESNSENESFPILDLFYLKDVDPNYDVYVRGDIPNVKGQTKIWIDFRCYLRDSSRDYENIKLQVDKTKQFPIYYVGLKMETVRDALKAGKSARVTNGLTNGQQTSEDSRGIYLMDEEGNYYLGYAAPDDQTENTFDLYTMPILEPPVVRAEDFMNTDKFQSLLKGSGLDLSKLQIYYCTDLLQGSDRALFILADDQKEYVYSPVSFNYRGLSPETAINETPYEELPYLKIENDRFYDAVKILVRGREIFQANF